MCQFIQEWTKVWNCHFEWPDGYKYDGEFNLGRHYGKGSSANKKNRTHKIRGIVQKLAQNFSVHDMHFVICVIGT